MKNLAFCLILSILFSLSLQNCRDTENPSAKVCKAVKLTNDEKKSDDDFLRLIPDSCCYITGTGVRNGCYPFLKNNVTDYINVYESDEEEPASGVKIDCSGKFVSLASALLFLVILI